MSVGLTQPILDLWEQGLPTYAELFQWVSDPPNSNPQTPATHPSTSRRRDAVRGRQWWRLICAIQDWCLQQPSEFHFTDPELYTYIWTIPSLGANRRTADGRIRPCPVTSIRGARSQLHRAGRLYRLPEERGAVAYDDPVYGPDEAEHNSHYRFVHNRHGETLGDALLWGRNQYLAWKESRQQRKVQAEQNRLFVIQQDRLHVQTQMQQRTSLNPFTGQVE